MASVYEFKPKFYIPLAWQELLEINDFDDYEKEKSVRVAKRRGGIPENSITPFRNDRREVTQWDDKYIICASLVSGSSNYWLEYAVYDANEMTQGVNPLYEGEPLDGIFSPLSLRLTTNVTLVVDVRVKTVYA